MSVVLSNVRVLVLILTCSTTLASQFRHSPTLPQNPLDRVTKAIPRGGGHHGVYGGGAATPTAFEDAVNQLANSDVNLDDLIAGAYGWCCNLGAPSALVAGAVVATIYETLKDPETHYQPGRDTKIVGFFKKLVRCLLVSAFALESITIFITTVTGSMLLETSAVKILEMSQRGGKPLPTTPLTFLRDFFEFEYLTARLTLLQGIINWLVAIALSHAIPTSGQSKSVIVTNRFLAAILCTTAIFMLSFYNGHSTLYPNLGVMLYRWSEITWKRYAFTWPPRPLTLVLFPCILFTLYLGIQAFLEIFDDGPESKAKLFTDPSQ